MFEDEVESVISYTFLQKSLHSDRFDTTTAQIGGRFVASDLRLVESPKRIWNSKRHEIN